MNHKLFFKINDGPESVFAEVANDAPFTITFNEYPTKEMVEKLTDYSLIEFRDSEGNKFKIYSKPD